MGAAAVDWLVVDHYALDARWETLAGSASRHLMVIDDLANRPHDCKLLLDQNLNRKVNDYAGLVPGYTDILAGPRYALLRPDFSAMREYSFTRRVQARLERLLVSMGGIDRDNATGQVLDALMSRPLPVACRITVVMGGRAPWLPEVRAQARQMQAVEILVDVQDMAQLMADSDLAIGAAGTSAWERCCLGLPTLTMVLADNQRGSALALSEAGAVSLLQGGGGLPMELNAKITSLSVARNMLDMQEACRAVCDGMGVSRVMEAMNHAN
jgi:UDP-2,4-diacetamido-2,4,6-trideoxy-beta-L-altropyranose hydrolase